MAKIGRNEKCPCRSGKKFKHCCALEESGKFKQLTPEQAMKVNLLDAVKQIQNDGENKTALSRELGVFFFFSTTEGDAWLMEMTDCDCVQVAAAGKALEVAIDENSETIEINWSHTFKLANKTIEVTTYEDRVVTVLTGGPSKELSAAIKRIRRKFTPEQLDQVHVAGAEDAA
ncbi:MAG: preprotein translocase subunit SecA [Desulfotalea sp.]|nr:MAG: preprotein translocase subunit SecA [Desulfotalea sp.]